jgi:hypothetical protein
MNATRIATKSAAITFCLFVFILNTLNFFTFSP